MSAPPSLSTPTLKESPIFKPILWDFSHLKYSPSKLFHDLLAGLIVGVIAVPLSIAFAIASGVKPEQGLITAVIGGFLISCFSGSRFQIGGPTGAFIVIIFSIVQKHGYEGLALATLMAGVLLIIMGIFRLGDVIKFIPYPVTIGFTGGIAVIIFSSQVRDFVGIDVASLPNQFHEKWIYYFTHISHIDGNTILLSTLTLLILLIWPKISRRVPGPLIAIIVTTALVYFLHIPIETIGSRFGSVSNTFPSFHFPVISWEKITELSSSALAIALLAGIESLLSAVVADGMTGDKHRSNTELIGQGIANIVSPLFYGIPSTGAIARTAANIKNGGQSPISGMVHSIVVLVIFLYLGQLAALIPMATLAGILVFLAYSMGEWHLFTKIFKGPKSDALVLWVTFLLTVFVDLTVAIEVGVVLASFLFMRQMINATEVGYIKSNLDIAPEGENDPDAISKKTVPPEVEIFEIQGPFFFGAANKFKDTLNEFEKKPKILILRLRFVPMIDATGLHALEEVSKTCIKDGIIILLSGVRPSLRKILDETGVSSYIGEKNVLNNIDEALGRANDLLHKVKSIKF